jgi:hypothetical protein
MVNTSYEWLMMAIDDYYYIMVDDDDDDGDGDDGDGDDDGRADRAGSSVCSHCSLQWTRCVGMHPLPL